ncbi:hypothetical protein DL240_10365 [Lujinxingia litoralis]|uniref:Outer membrane protein beta-barrel domain-containing protein n=1 Tax=Lujinxingia litoralis TaxID=2211119 RepID=A0A328C6R6_9DELT|nr:MXAN_2562 family outer membrane beta-barrel protein [Lujinxingia litoralis]RAL22248.1 hypothetical protein DL240_10365 [Lujinxingia litoralis]
MNVSTRARHVGGPLVSAGVVMMAVMLSGAAAQAQSPVSGVLEIKGGAYSPRIDQEFGGAEGPFESFFGGKSMVLGEVEYDHHLWRGFGKLSLGFNAGYGSVSARVHTPEGMPIEVSDEARFRVIPLRAGLVYRYDYSALHHNIPLVPKLKAGLDYHLWRVVGPDGETAGAGEERAAGGKFGWHVTAGLNFHLDFIDQGSAAAFDMSWGVNNSYLFAEYTWANVDNFGGEGLDLSTSHFAFGLAFEF